MTLREKPASPGADPRARTERDCRSWKRSLSPRWDDFAADYEARVEPVTTSFVEEMLDPFSLFRPDNGRPSKLLDVGCGTGGPALLAKGLGFDVTAFDVDPSMVSKLVDRDDDGSIECVVRDGQNLPEEFSDAFEYVVSSFSLPFFPDPSRGLREIRRCLLPGGRCVVSTWGDRSEAPAFRIVPDAVRAVAPDLVGSPASDKKKNSYVGSTSELVGRMEEAGLVGVEVVGPVMRTLLVPSPEAYYERFVLRSPPTLAMISWMEENMEDGTSEKFKAKVMELAAERGGSRTDGEVAIVSPAYFVYGTKPP